VHRSLSNVASISTNDVDLSLFHLSVGQLVGLPVCVWKVYCGKMADWIRMLFGMVTGVGRGNGVLDGVIIVKGEGAVFAMNFGVPL